MLKILYVSTFSSPKTFEYIFESAERKPGQAVQKFHNLILDGLAKHDNECMLDVLSSLPVVPKSHKRKSWFIKNEWWNGIYLRYIPFLNYPILKHFFIVIGTIIKFSHWRIKNLGNNSIVICDILNNGIVWTIFVLCKLTSQKMLVIVTDVPGIMMNNKRKSRSITEKIILTVSRYVLQRFDFFVLLTPQMNAIVNPYNKPFVVMEGMVDSEFVATKRKFGPKTSTRVILYAGGLNEGYGIKNLIEAFCRLEDRNLELHLYGHGDMDSDIAKFREKDDRIKFFGVITNKIVVNKLSLATVLINPRPTLENFTLYSFPSKNMEYMVSGTPLLTTKLPGMPAEYYDFVYLIENESADGIYDTLKQVLNKSDKDLYDFGRNAQKFVMEKKSNVIQVKQVLNLIKDKNSFQPSIAS
jgi:glycosyltransferase involved in cell wall biosynthesis